MGSFRSLLYVCVLISCVFSQRQKFVKLNKVSLTQKGYIQFLRYVTDVPPIGDFTFCIWLRSANLTHSHPLLSYSKEEAHRYIRAWLTPFGEELRLAVKERDVIRVPVHLKEHQWYHICQSWSTVTGHWDLYLNGKLKQHGFNDIARGTVLPKGGDIVVGQEYTDFDKGLDDGIEGDIFGFNMVLSATTGKNQFAEKPLSRRHGHKPQGHVVQSPVLRFRRKRAAPFRPYRHQPVGTGGAQLVELSRNCALAGGAPLSGREVLVSWTRTPVRVFGGALLKSVDPFCA